MRESLGLMGDYEGEVGGGSGKEWGNYVMMKVGMGKWEGGKLVDEVVDRVVEVVGVDGMGIESESVF